VPAPEQRRPSVLTDQRKGLLIVLSGPSGVGKGEILKRARARLNGFTEVVESVSVTTREPRADERDGVQFHFRSRPEFEAMRERGEFLEWAEYVGNLYGTPRSWVEEQLAAGRDVVLEIEVQGGLQVSRERSDAVLVFVAPPSWEELRRRLEQRRTESAETREERMATAKRELSQVHEYDYVIVNDRLDDAIEAFVSVVRAEHCRAKRQDLEFLTPPQ
jgi:guanylate kinase